MTKIVFILEDDKGRYFAGTLMRPRWTSSIFKAQRYDKEEAEQLKISLFSLSKTTVSKYTLQLDKVYVSI